jgi:hypothetical protein
MEAFFGAETRQPREPRDIFSEPGGLDLYTQVEGLTSEEDRILETSEHERTEEEHARLRNISGELDRAWEHLRDRAERRQRAG